jgi:uncharacterized membrane protein YwzB
MMSTQNGVVLNELQSQRKPTVEHADDSAPYLVSSLELLQSDGATDDTLLEIMERHSKALRFLKYTANWVSKGHNGLLHYAVYNGSRVVLFLMLLLLVVFVFRNAFRSSKFTTQYVATDIAVVLELVSVLIAQYLNQSRLAMKAQRHDAIVIEESVRISQYFLLASVGTVATSIIVYMAGQLETNAMLASNVILLVLGGACVSQNMAFNLFFIVMDLKVSSLLLDQLHILADKRLLTMQVFTKARADITRRNDNSRWASDFIAGPCVASLIAITAIVFTLGQGEWSLGIAWVIAMVKELLFICVAFWYVAKVNEKADALTVKLSSETWLPTSLAHQCAACSDMDVTEKATNLAPAQLVGSGRALSSVVWDLQRLSVHASSVSKPISFTLLFKRASWQNVIVSAVGFVVTVVIGLIKSIVKSAAV